MSDAKVIPMVEVHAVEMMPMPNAGYAPSYAPAQQNVGSVSVPPGPYGNHINLQHVNPSSINIVYKAEFENFCLAGTGVFGCCYGPGCCLNSSRMYFYVLENAIESNQPSCFNRNPCCPGVDHIYKFYFDRGVFDQQGCDRALGCSRGTPEVFSNNVTFMCCCMECPSCCNSYQEGYFPSICGDRVRVVNAETMFCCCPTRSNACCNCCSLCGVKSGDPLPCYMVRLVQQLKPGSGKPLAEAMNNARAQWKQRTGSN